MGPIKTDRDPYRIQVCLLGAAALVFFVIIGFSGARRWSYNPDKHQFGTDFTAYYYAGRLALTTGNIYDYRSISDTVRPYIYPPMFAVFPMAPMAFLPHDAAAIFFYALNIVLMAAGLWFVWKMLAPEDEDVSSLSFWRRREVGGFLAVAICWRLLNSNLRLGNANMYIFFCLALALYLLAGRDKPTPSPFREFMAGIAVAFATTMKLTPGVFGLYFFWTFRRWAMLGGAVGLVLFLLFFPSLLLGFGQNWRCLTAFASSAREKALDEGDATQKEPDMLVGRPKKSHAPEDLPMAVGISFRGTLMKMLSRTDAITRGNVEGPHNVNFVDLDLKTSKAIADIVSLALLLLTVALTFPRWTQTGAFPLAISWSLTTTAMLLIAPLTREAHAVVMLIPVSVLLALLQQNKLTGLTRTLAIVSLAVMLLAGIVTSQDVLGDRLSQVVHAYGETTWSMLLVYVALAAGLFQVRLANSDA